MHAVNLLQKFSLFDDYWSPKIVGELNGQHVKLVKCKGEFVWHAHEAEDELFMVVKGTLKMAFRDRVETIRENELIIVPRGIEHKPIADEEVWIMLFEPMNTINTGNAPGEMTKEELGYL